MDSKYIIQILLSLPKTIWFNIRYLPFSYAKKLPIYVHYRTRVKAYRGNIDLSQNDKLKLFAIKFGNRGSEGVVEKHYNYICFEKKARVIFKGRAAFGLGSALNVAGTITFGNRFAANKNLFISCSKEIEFQDNVLCGWNVDIRDTDGHTVYLDNEPKESMKPIYIYNHVWICSDVKIFKGVTIGADSVVASSAVVTKGSSEHGVCWAGFPAKIIQRGINWDSKVLPQ